MGEKYIVDRIEGEYVILEKENGHMCRILDKNIEGIFKEGDILVKDGQSFKRDENLTKLRIDKINNIMKNMWQ